MLVMQVFLFMNVMGWDMGRMDRLHNCLAFGKSTLRALICISSSVESTFHLRRDTGVESV